MYKSEMKQRWECKLRNILSIDGDLCRKAEKRTHVIFGKFQSRLDDMKASFTALSFLVFVKKNITLP